MINLLIGPPGGGKSYEAVVYHVLPALNAGRKVITNLPLDLTRLEILGFPVGLVEMRETTLSKRQGLKSNRCFAFSEDYGSTWRNEENGSGPLYVIDECHLALPRGATEIAVEEWFSLHRHESADVLLITQSYGKVSRSIIDLVQVCYRVKKGTAFGTATNYIRKVQDGVRGDVVNTAVRKYENRYFGLYKSHTRGGGAELAANDIIPMWKRWPFIGAALFLTFGGGIFAFGPASINPLKNGVAKAKPEVQTAKPVRVVETLNGQVISDTADKPKPEVVAVESGHPYSGRGLHIIGTVESSKGKKVLFAVSQNGQTVSQVTSVDLKRLGYQVDTPSDCAVRVRFDAFDKWVICDAPQISITPDIPQSKPKVEKEYEPSEIGPLVQKPQNI